MKALVLAVGLLGFAFPAGAHAEKVKLEVKVVEASTHGTASDPRLKHMEADFKHKGFAYSSYKLISDQSPTLDLKASTEIGLPNGRKVVLSPQQVEANKMIKMHVSIPGLLDSLDYSVGNNGTYFLGAGPNGHGSTTESQVFLVIKHTAQ